MASLKVSGTAVRRSFGLLAALVLLCAAAAPARATIADRGTFTGTWTDQYEECGLTIDVEGREQGWYHYREGTSPHTRTAFFEHLRFTWHESHTASNGVTITMGGTVTSNEVRSTHLEGNVYRFDVIRAGRHFTVWDADGRRIFAERGQVRFSYLFDTHGDDVPGGTFLGIVDESWRGHFLELDWCGLFQS